MIGRLKGIIDSYGEDFIVLDVNGVGYLVHCSARTLQELPAAGEPATLAIETHVREDQIRLFGFLTEVEREWFRLLQTVQGVGAKVALGLSPTPLVDDTMMDRKLVVADVDTGALVSSFKNPGKLGRFTWSPDGKLLAKRRRQDHELEDVALLQAVVPGRGRGGGEEGEEGGAGDHSRRPRLRSWRAGLPA